MKPSRSLVKQALKVAQSPRQEFRLNKALAQLSEQGFGTCFGRSYQIDRVARKALRDWLAAGGIAWTTPLSALDGDRIDVSRFVTNEKVATQTTAAKRVLVAPMGPEVQINGHPLPVIEGAFISMAIGDIVTVDARQLLIIENKAAFERMAALSGDFDRLGVLAVYRSDPQNPHGQQWAQQAASWNNIPLAACMDFDPAGLSMGISSGAQRLLVPKLEDLMHLDGSQDDFRNQHIDWLRLRPLADNPHTLTHWVRFLRDRRAGFTQERLISHAVRHEWVVLPDEVADDS